MAALMTETDPVADVLSSYRPGLSLTGAFYTDPGLYQSEIQQIWLQDWLFVATGGEIPSPGDYLVVNIAGQSVIVTRQRDGSVAAMHNVCRHRGSIVATEQSGNTKSFVCPYHQWSYDLDGSLKRCRGMAADLDKSAFGLRPVHVADISGLIYVSLADEPEDIAAARALMEPMTLPQGLATAKVACAVEYDIAANWKLVWENNRECFHCVGNHPQYVVANFDRYDEGELNERIEREIAAATARSQQAWAACGLIPDDLVERGLAEFPSPDGKSWYSANRTAMVDGYLSESMDGARVAPLIGDYTRDDIGVLRLRTLPNFWHHGSCDHSVVTRLLPNGPRSTTARVTWLVHPEAVAGVDYTLEALMPFWQLTSEQDWLICERQQQGVESRAYLPGPLSVQKEYNVANFHAWYLGRLHNQK